MYNKYLVASSLHQIQSLLNTISERTKNVTDVNDFLSSPNGMILLDAVCMNLIALGEAVKNLDKVSDGELLPKYNQIQWGEGKVQWTFPIAKRRSNPTRLPFA